MVVIYAFVLAGAAIVLTAPFGARETVMYVMILPVAPIVPVSVVIVAAVVASLDAVPLQNRVTPPVATPEQGRATPNRGRQFTTNHPWPCQWEARNGPATS